MSTGYYAFDHEDDHPNYRVAGYRRAGRKIDTLVLHTTESDELWNTEAASKYMLRSSYEGRPVSWHASVGADGILWNLPDYWVAGHAGSSWNERSIGFEMCHSASNWGRNPAYDAKVVENAAIVAAVYCRRYVLPHELGTHKQDVDMVFPGMVRHSQLSTQRSDPGTSFPVNTFLTRVKQYTAAGVVAIGDVLPELVSPCQEELAALGFYEGEIDGHFGPMTADAVFRAEVDMGLIERGIAWPGRFGGVSEEEVAVTSVELKLGETITIAMPDGGEYRITAVV